MARATKRRRIGQFAWAMVAILAIALILILSIATTLGAAAHSFDHTTLALPIFFLFLLLPVLVDEWLDIEDSIFTSKPRFSPVLSRGPPA